VGHLSLIPYIRKGYFTRKLIRKDISLSQVNLSGNSLTEFPDVFKDLTSLDVLDISRNKIINIPDHVQNVQAVELILNQNQIAQVSEAVRIGIYTRY